MFNEDFKSKKDLKIIAKYLNLNLNININDLIWLIAIKLNSNMDNNTLSSLVGKVPEQTNYLILCHGTENNIPTFADFKNKKVYKNNTILVDNFGDDELKEYSNCFDIISMYNCSDLK